MYTVGDLLKKNREKNNLTITQVEKQTRIRSKYIRSIEENNWKEFPSKVYITGLIRSYSDFLGVDPAKALAYFRREYEKTDEVKFRKQIPSLHFLPETRKIIIGIIVVIVLLFLGYFGYQLNLYFAAPDIQIVSPTKEVFRNTEKIRIVGKVDDESTVKIFGDSYYPDTKGKIVYEFPLKKGKNTVTFEVTGANGRKTFLTKEYILE